MGVPYAEVIGDPIAHSKSPLIHKFWLERLGLVYDFRLTRVPPSALGAHLDACRTDPDWCGCSVTIPHKVHAAAVVDELSPPASAIGAVNHIIRKGRTPRLVGRNSDVAGFLEPLAPWLSDKREFLIASVTGTGGAAAAVTLALHWNAVTVFNHGRTWERAKQFRMTLGLEDDDFAQDLASLCQPVPSDFTEKPHAQHLLVNTTPLGMTGYDPLPINLDLFPADTIVYDLVYAPVETQLLRQAHERGMPTIDGLAMLIGQADIAFEQFFAATAPRQHDAELRERLAS